MIRLNINSRVGLWNFSDEKPGLRLRHSIICDLSQNLIFQIIDS